VAEDTEASSKGRAVHSNSPPYLSPPSSWLGHPQFPLQHLPQAGGALTPAASLWQGFNSALEFTSGSVGACRGRHRATCAPPSPAVARRLIPAPRLAGIRAARGAARAQRALARGRRPRGWAACLKIWWRVSAEKSNLRSKGRAQDGCKTWRGKAIASPSVLRAAVAALYGCDKAWRGGGRGC